MPVALDANRWASRRALIGGFALTLVPREVSRTLITQALKAVGISLLLVVGFALWDSALAQKPRQSAVQVRPRRGAIADAPVNCPIFHCDRQRTGWNPNEPALSPAAVSGGTFGKLWQTTLDTVRIGSIDYDPHLYASPLYVDVLSITDGGPYDGRQFAAVIAATGNGYVYAINAFDANGVAAGSILWKQFLGMPSRMIQDGGPPIGVLGTPVIDLDATPPTVYVAADTAPPSFSTRSWRVFGLDLGSGNMLPGWPLDLNDDTLSPINENGPASFQTAATMSQRGGLNLSWDRTVLYVPFGSYNDGGAGWMVAIDTGLGSGTPQLLSAFSAAPWSNPSANGGMWASGGAGIDPNGNVYAVTGNSPAGSIPQTWGESVLVWAPDLPLHLVGTYTPWNHCQLDSSDVDLCGSGVVILPDLDPTTTSTPHLISLGGKQGNAYVVDRDNMPGNLVQRPPCSASSLTDGSLWDPTAPRPYLNNHPGPLNIFGPYSEIHAQVDQAKARSTPAYFLASNGTSYLFLSGSTKESDGSSVAIPPSLARVQVVTAPNQPAFLRIDAYEPTLVFKSPGTPMVTSNGSNDPIIWVLEPNVYRSAALVGSSVHPQLHAIDATTMQVLFSSDPTDPDMKQGGKYNHPVVARGVVFTGTDRITAWGLPPGFERIYRTPRSPAR